MSLLAAAPGTGAVVRLALGGEAQELRDLRDSLLGQVPAPVPLLGRDQPVEDRGIEASVRHRLAGLGEDRPRHLG